MHTLNQTRPTTKLTPQQISLMLAQRRERASREAGNYGLFVQGNGVWSVVSRDGRRIYQVTATSCTCPDFQNRGAELQSCKHTYIIRTEEERLAEEAVRERVKRTMREDFPADDYDRKPTPSDPFGPLPDPAPEARWWEDQMRAAEYADWLSEQMDSGLNYPCD